MRRRTARERNSGKLRKPRRGVPPEDGRSGPEDYHAPRCELEKIAVAIRTDVWPSWGQGHRKAIMDIARKNVGVP